MKQLIRAEARQFNSTFKALKAAESELFLFLCLLRDSICILSAYLLLHRNIFLSVNSAKESERRPRSVRKLAVCRHWMKFSSLLCCKPGETIVNCAAQFNLQCSITKHLKAVFTLNALFSVKSTTSVGSVKKKSAD